MCRGSHHREAEVLPQAWEGGLPESCTLCLSHQGTSPLAVWSLGHAVVLSSRLPVMTVATWAGARRRSESGVGVGGSWLPSLPGEHLALMYSLIFTR